LNLWICYRISTL